MIKFIIRILRPLLFFLFVYLLIKFTKNKKNQKKYLLLIILMPLLFLLFLLVASGRLLLPVVEKELNAPEKFVEKVLFGGELPENVTNIKLIGVSTILPPLRYEPLYCYFETTPESLDYLLKGFRFKRKYLSSTSSDESKNIVRNNDPHKGLRSILTKEWLDNYGNITKTINDAELYDLCSKQAKYQMLVNKKHTEVYIYFADSLYLSRRAISHILKIRPSLRKYLEDDVEPDGISTWSSDVCTPAVMVQRDSELKKQTDPTSPLPKPTVSEESTPGQNELK